MASTPSSSATSTIWSRASSVSWATVVLMLTRSGACLRLAASWSRRRPGAGALERALQPARRVVHLARAVNRDADVLEKAGCGEVRKRFGAFLGDDGAVGGQVAAGVALLVEEIEHGHDVLAHEDLAAGQADLEPGLVRERAARGTRAQLLPPLAFDVEQVADVAELAVQVAPHGRFVDSADRQAIGPPGLLGEEPLDPALVLAPPEPRPRVARERKRPRGESRRRARRFTHQDHRYLPDLQRRARAFQRLDYPAVGIVQERLGPLSFRADDAGTIR